jgi:hypothetical protein
MNRKYMPAHILLNGKTRTKILIMYLSTHVISLLQFDLFIYLFIV